MHENAELLTLLSSSLSPLLLSLSSLPLPPYVCVGSFLLSLLSRCLRSSFETLLSLAHVPFYLARSFSDPISRSQTPLLPLISISIPLAETGVSLSAPIWNFFADVTPYLARSQSSCVQPCGILSLISMIVKLVEKSDRIRVDF